MKERYQNILIGLGVCIALFLFVSFFHQMENRWPDDYTTTFEFRGEKYDIYYTGSIYEYAIVSDSFFFPRYISGVDVPHDKRHDYTRDDLIKQSVKRLSLLTRYKVIREENVPKYPKKDTVQKEEKKLKPQSPYN